MPIRTYTEAGALILDTDLMDQGVCIGTVSASPGSYVTKAWPSLNGAQIVALSSNGGNDVAVTYPGGVPTVTLQPSGGYPQYATVWAYGTRTVRPTSGLWAETPGGGISMAPEAYGLHFAGRATFVTHVAGYGDRGGGQLGHSQLQFDSPEPPVVLIRLDAGQYVTLLNVSPHPSVAGRWLIHCRAVTENAWPAWPTLQVPIVYCFTRRTTRSAATIAVYDDSGGLMWDLGAPGLLYPVRVARVPLDSSTSNPGGVIGVCGAPQSIARTEDAIDEFNDPPQWWVFSDHEGHWHRDGGGTVWARYLQISCSGMTGEYQSPYLEPATSQMVLANVSNY